MSRKYRGRSKSTEQKDSAMQLPRKDQMMFISPIAAAKESSSGNSGYALGMIFQRAIQLVA